MTDKPEMMTTMCISAEMVADAMIEDPAFMVVVFGRMAKDHRQIEMADFLAGAAEAGERGVDMSAVAQMLKILSLSVKAFSEEMTEAANGR
jgi:hypothetical protein